MRKVLILGGGGFIGVNIARTLMDDGGYDLTLADQGFRGRLEEYFPDADERERLTVVKDDFTRPSSFDRLADAYDDVYMLAAVVGVNRTLAHPEEVIRVNTALHHYTLEWLGRSRVGKVLFASSSENYAGTTDVFGYAVPTPETVPLCIEDITHRRFTYAVTKIHGESAFLHSGPTLGFRCTVVRYQNVFGPFMGFRHVIPHLVQRFHQGQRPFVIYGGEQTRALCYVSDAARGTILATESERADGEVYHVGNPDEISIDMLSRAVGELMGYDGDYVEGPAYPGSVRRRCPHITKCREHLGYEPEVDWRTGLERTVEWYRAFFESGRRPDDVGFEPPEQFAAR